MFAIGWVEGLAVGEGSLDVVQPATGFGEFFEALAVQGSFEGATIGVAAKNGVLHVEDFDGVFDGGCAAIHVRSSNGDDIAGVASDEEVTGAGLQDEVGDDAGVRAGDEEVFRGLHLGQQMKIGAFGGKDVLMKPLVAFNQLIHKSLVSPKTCDQIQPIAVGSDGS